MKCRTGTFLQYSVLTGEEIFFWNLWNAPWDCVIRGVPRPWQDPNIVVVYEGNTFAWFQTYSWNEDAWHGKGWRRHKMVPKCPGPSDYWIPVDKWDNSQHRWKWICYVSPQRKLRRKWHDGEKQTRSTLPLVSKWTRDRVTRTLLTKAWLDVAMASFLLSACREQWQMK